ncbi:hypothetical protein HNQ91_002495 [Filimonas zeae]|uniref:hypothetical protein n=1 Tax=Filimonas zeae TaxID=1737353 RepID=UPI0016665AF0|nr:hypothetical protein [Filimonas zeae]MDR6339444.1 hypothetical protein [Filimonas zeae]
MYDISEEEVTALLKQLQNTPAYNKAIINGIWKFIGAFLSSAFFCAFYAGMGSSVGGLNTVCVFIAAICGLSSLTSLMGVIARLSEMRAAKKKEETLPEQSGKELNKTALLKPDVIAILITTPLVAAIIITMPVLYIKLSGSKILNSNRWQLHQDIVLQEDCKRVREHDKTTSPDYYLLLSGDNNKGYIWNSDDHYFSFHTAAPDKYLKKGDTIDIYTSEADSLLVYDIGVKGNHLLNLKKRNELAEEQGINSAIKYGVILAIIFIIIMLTKDNWKVDDEEDETLWPPPGYTPSYHRDGKYW